MRASLGPGLFDRLTFHVPETKTVPDFGPESSDFSGTPEVFGLCEWPCIEPLREHCDLGDGKLFGLYVRHAERLDVIGSGYH